VKVLQHVPEHLVVFLGHAIAPLDIIPQPEDFNTLSLLLGAYPLDLGLHPCPPLIIILPTFSLLKLLT